jgi:hypothetical protein
MRNENIETAELSDADLDNVAGGLLDGGTAQLGNTVEGVLGADLGGVATDLGGLNVAPSTGVSPVTGLNL